MFVVRRVGRDMDLLSELYCFLVLSNSKGVSCSQTVYPKKLAMEYEQGVQEMSPEPLKERQEALSKGSPPQVSIPQIVTTSLEISPPTLSPVSYQKLAAYLQRQQDRHTSVLASGSHSLRVCDVISDTNLFIPPVEMNRK